jgi:hypothetical protein
MQITSQQKMHRLVLKWGILPFFANKVEGFSIQEHTPEELWFTDEQLASPWEWKGPVITEWDCTYGKFFKKKAGFVSLEWLPDFMNWRRSQYPISDYPSESRHILKVLHDNESMLSKELKKASGFTLSRKKKYDSFGCEDIEANRFNGSSFDKLIADLQMGTYVVIADFEYQFSSKGDRYGWGVARYCTPEALFGAEIAKACQGRTPQQSREHILVHLQTLFPQADSKRLLELI